MIRAATEADAPAIAEIQARAWRWAYSDFLDEDAMPVPSERLEFWQDVVAGGTLRVFDQDGVVAGYAYVTGDQLEGLYVDPGAQGAGVGAALHDDALARIAATGHERAWLYVFVDNAQGRAFYEHRDWRREGEPVREPHWHGAAYRYERAL